MHPSLTTTYILPAILLNPVLFLHSVNTLLSRLLPPLIAATPIQPPPYSALGPSGSYPHIDMHASDNLCWSYTAVMVCAQLVAFGRVSQSREERKERREMKRKREERRPTSSKAEHVEGKEANGGLKLGNGAALHGIEQNGKPRAFVRDDSEGTEGTEDEIIL